MAEEMPGFLRFSRGRVLPRQRILIAIDGVDRPIRPFNAGEGFSFAAPSPALKGLSLARALNAFVNGVLFLKLAHRGKQFFDIAGVLPQVPFADAGAADRV